MADQAAILNFIGGIVVYGGGPVAIGFALFSFLGKKWIENKFKARLEDLKQEHREELENLKFEISTQFNRIIKIHEIEIEVLPTTWKKLQRSLRIVKEFVIQPDIIQDLNKFEQEELSEFLDGTNFTNSEKNKVLNTKEDKIKIYNQISFIYKAMRVRKRYLNFHVYLEDNSLFIDRDLRALFIKLDKNMWEAIINREAYYKYDTFDQWKKAWNAIENESIQPILNDIERLVQDRLKVEMA